MPFQIDPNNYYATYLSAANELEGMIGGNAARPQMELIRGGAAQGNIDQVKAALKTLNAMAEQVGKAQSEQAKLENEGKSRLESALGGLLGQGRTPDEKVQGQIGQAVQEGKYGLAASIAEGFAKVPQGADNSDAAKKEKDAKELKIRQLTQRLTSTQSILRDPELGDTFGRSLPMRKYQEYTSGTGSRIRAQLESLKGSFLSGGMAEMKAGAGSTGNPSATEAEAIAKSVSPLSLEMPVSAAKQELLSITNKTIRSLKELGANPAIYTLPSTLKKYNESPDASPFDTSVDVAKPTPANAAGGNVPTGSGVVKKPMSFTEAFYGAE